MTHPRLSPCSSFLIAYNRDVCSPSFYGHVSTEVIQFDGYGDFREYIVPGGKAGECYIENLPQNKPIQLE